MRRSVGASIGVTRWNQAQAWAISTRMAHPGLVSEADFIAAQAIRAARPMSDGTTHRYLLAGLLVCRRCGRHMDAYWVNDRPAYRFRHGRTSAKPPATGHHETVYRREDRILTELAANLGPHAAGKRRRRDRAVPTGQPLHDHMRRCRPRPDQRQNAGHRTDPRSTGLW
ncbi:MAG: site-specific recombinase [Micromonosporaceae bacterium]|nr:site-specific recombinase [Micromonosporaceae bacterium]